jgi:hypothetical protein
MKPGLCHWVAGGGSLRRIVTIRLKPDATIVQNVWRPLSNQSNVGSAYWRS